MRICCHKLIQLGKSTKAKEFSVARLGGWENGRGEEIKPRQRAKERQREREREREIEHTHPS